MKPIEHIMSMKSKRVLSVVEANREIGFRFEVLFAVPAGFGVVHDLGFHENYQMDVYKSFE
jgi:hypothetical protein